MLASMVAKPIKLNTELEMNAFTHRVSGAYDYSLLLIPFQNVSRGGLA
jgi:hypothetical protein